jgi:hypothetical protein
MSAIGGRIAGWYASGVKSDEIVHKVQQGLQSAVIIERRTMAEIFISLSPAESLLLFNNGYSSRQALKVTLLELIARKILRVETRQEQRVFRKEAVQYLRVLVHHLPDAPAHVASLLDTLKAAQPGGGIALDAVTKLLRNRYGNKVDMFKDDLLLPALVERGLMAEQRSGLFWLGKRLQLTRAGEAEHKRIAAAAGKARQIVELLKTAPARAAVVALEVGQAILLLDRLSFELRDLGETIRKHRETGAKPDPGSTELATYDFELVDKTVVVALDECLRSFGVDQGFAVGT